MKLYYMPGACSLSDHIALEWTGADYDIEKVDRAHLKDEAFLKLNPMGSVPCLQDGDFVLTQNMAILEYLDEKYPQALLLGSDDIRERAEARRWLAFCNSDLHGAFVPFFAPNLYVGDESLHEDLKHRAVSRIQNLLGVVDKVLEGRDYLSGKKSVADAYLFVILRWAQGMNIDFSSHTRLTRFFETMASDEGVQAALKQEGL